MEHHTHNAANDHDLLNRQGVTLFGQGKVNEAKACFEKALALKADFAEALCNIAAIHQHLGEAGKAVTAWQMVLSSNPNFYPAHTALARATLPGDDYYAMLGRMHTALAPRTYVEIGFKEGKTLALAKSPTQAIGIDPAPRITHKFSAKTRTYPVTSNDFFATRNLTAELGGLPVDLAFIDGLHVFSQALQDFVNLERHAHRHAVICIHDCLPLNRLTSSPARETAFWSGDPWKVIVILKKYRPDLELFTIPAYPTGLGVVTNLDPESTLLADNLADIVREFSPLDFSYLDSDREEKLNLVQNHWPKIMQKLASLIYS